MKKIFVSAFGFIKRRWIISGLGLVVLIIVLSLIFSKGSSSVKTVAVQKGEIISDVSVTGTVTPSQNLDLNFTQSGRISSISVNVGDKVYAGEVMAKLDNSDLAAQVSQAQANIDIQQAKLDQLQRGSRPEDIKVTESDLNKSKVDLAGYYSGVINILNDAYAKSDDAIRNQIDQFFINDNTSNPQLTFVSSDSQGTNDVQFERVLVEKELNQWQSELPLINASSSNSVLDSAMVSAQSHLSIIRNLLNELMNVLQMSVGLSQSTLNTYKTNLNVARTNVNLASTNISNQQQLIASQEALVQKNQDQYNLILAGSDPQDIAAQQAQVDQAKASLAYAQAQYQKTLLISPFEGTVTRIIPSVGDVVGVNDIVLSLIGSGNYQIDANIAETDISKIKIGQTAQVTLDAYGPDVIFDAKVVRIDLSSTELEGVATYKTTFQFVKNDSRILSGLTANVDVLSAKKENVLYIPTRDIIQDSNNQYVNVLADSKTNKINKVKVTTGLVGSNGMTEITSGLNEGDLVVSE